MKIIEAKGLVRNYVSEERSVEVLKGLDFAVEEQEFVGIMGRSGSGKTTLLRTLGLIDEPTGGRRKRCRPMNRPGIWIRSPATR